MTETYTIQIPGQGTALQVQELRTELLDAFLSRRSFPLRRVFELLPPNTDNTPVTDAIAGRGMLEVKENTFVNDDEPIDATVIDNAGRSYALFIPARLVLRVEQGAALRLVTDVEVLFTLGNLPPELNYGEQFVLSELEFGATTVLFRAAEAGNPDHRLVIQVNLVQRDGVFRFVRERGLAKRSPSPLALIAAEAMGDSSCCSEPRRPRPPRPLPPARVCVRIHIKILAPLSAPIDMQFNAMSQVFSPAGIQVERGTVEMLPGLAHLLDLDAGRCVLGETSSEQNALFEYRKDVGPGELVVYFVQTLVMSGGIQLAGCASHPRDRPGCVVTVTANLWTLAHEVGHVLGLIHVDDNRRLMTKNGTFAIIEPPPDLADSEINTIKTSGWVRAC